MDFYLITGFLGAGKTTFLKKFVKLIAPARMHVIINEFGSEGVDGELVRQLGIAMAEINNGSIFCACRLDKFEEELKKAVAQSPDVIIAEASGLADPTNVQKVLSDFADINYRGSICLADAVRLQKVFHTAQVSRRQLNVASLVLLNKTDSATPEQLQTSQQLIAEANPGAVVKQTTYGDMPSEWLQYVRPVTDIDEVLAAKDITLQKQTLCISADMTLQQLTHCVNMLSDSCYRIKGFVTTAQGDKFVDCTGSAVEISDWNGNVTGRLVLLAGKGMPLRKAVKEALSWYPTLLSVETAASSN